MIKLPINCLIEQLQGEEVIASFRILYITPEQTRVAIFNVESKIAIPEWCDYDELVNSILTGSTRLAEVDKFLPPNFNEQELNSERFKVLKAGRDKARNIIEPLVTGENEFLILLKKYRNKLIQERIEQINIAGENISRQWILHHLRSYWRGRQSYNALIPHYYKSGGRGKKRSFKRNVKPGPVSLITKKHNIQTGIVINDEWREIIVTGGKLFFEKLERRTLKEAYDLTLTNLCSEIDKETGKLIIPDPNKGEIFSFRQFTYHYQKNVENNLKRALTRRYGQRNFEMYMREPTGTMSEGIFGPGSLYQIDATVVDISLVRVIDRLEIVGRPVIYAVIDVFSVMVVGIAICLESENWLGYAEALVNVVEDKEKFCAEYGITLEEGEWVNSHFPNQILGDRGSLERSVADNLAYGLSTQVSNAAARRPDWKAYVEKIFDLFNFRVIHKLPGAVPQHPEHGQKDYRINSEYDFYEFCRIAIKMVTNFNNETRLEHLKMDADMIADGVEPYPRDLYLWGQLNRSVPMRERSFDEVRNNLLPDEEARVTANGIEFRNLTYTCEQATTEGWELKAKNLGNWKIKVAYHPRKTEPVYIRLGDGNEPLVCYLKDRNSPYKESNWAEVNQYFEGKKLKAQLSTGRRRASDAELYSFINKETKSAEEKNQTARVSREKLKSDSARLKAIPQNKRDEIEFLRQKDKLSFGGDSTASNESQNDSKFVTDNDFKLSDNKVIEENYIGIEQPSNLRFLREQRLKNETKRNEQK